MYIYVSFADEKNLEQKKWPTLPTKSAEGVYILVGLFLCM